MPHVAPSPDVVTLFQGFWFVTAVFRLSENGASGINDWKGAALARIAAKTPGLVPEESHDYLSSDVEYNRSLRKDYAELVRLYLDCPTSGF